MNEVTRMTIVIESAVHGTSTYLMTYPTGKVTHKKLLAAMREVCPDLHRCDCRMTYTAMTQCQWMGHNERWHATPMSPVPLDGQFYQMQSAGPTRDFTIVPIDPLTAPLGGTMGA